MASSKACSLDLVFLSILYKALAIKMCVYMWVCGVLGGGVL